eukprot:m.101728 g.101728  ORF g.101728 m.101728 type:complete len:1976 (-) comp9066_c0_seq1:2611-8538(-)
MQSSLLDMQLSASNLLGQRPTYLNYACMSLLTYRDFSLADIKNDHIAAAIEKDTKLPADKIKLSIDAWENLRFNNWEVLEQIHKDSGMICTVFFHSERQQLVFAYRGTQPRNPKTIKADVFNVMKNKAGKINNDAADIARKYVNHNLFKKYPFVQVSFTGHSLGAWEAELVSLQFKIEKLLQRDVPQCYVDAWVVSFESPGSLDLMRDRMENISSIGEDPTNDLDVVIFMNKPNFINTFNKQCSQYIYQILGKAVNEPKSTILSHDMVTIYSGMVESYGKGQKENVKRCVLWPYRPWQKSSSDISDAVEINLTDLSDGALIYAETETHVSKNMPPDLRHFIEFPANYGHISSDSILHHAIEIINSRNYEFRVVDGFTLLDIKNALFQQVKLPEICKLHKIDPKDALLFSSGMEQEERGNIVQRTFPNFTYIGQVNAKEIPQGMGMAFFFDNTKYTGVWDRGQFCGSGVFIGNDFEYRGQFLKGKMEGYGMLRNVNSSSITASNRIVKLEDQKDAFIGQFTDNDFCATIDAQLQGLQCERQAMRRFEQVLEACDEMAHAAHRIPHAVQRMKSIKSHQTRIDWLKTHFGKKQQSGGFSLKAITQKISSSSSSSTTSNEVALETINIIPLLERCACACHLAGMQPSDQKDYLQKAYATKFSQPEIQSGEKGDRTPTICFIKEHFEGLSSKRIFLVFTPAINPHLSFDINSAYIQDALSRPPSHYIEKWLKRGYQVIVTGHSVGGLLCRMMCADVVSNTHLSLNKLRTALFCVSFAGPLLSDAKIFSHGASTKIKAKWEEWSKTNNHIVLKKNDPIPVLSWFCNPRQIVSTYTALASDDILHQSTDSTSQTKSSKATTFKGHSYSFDQSLLSRMKSYEIASVFWLVEDKIAKAVERKAIGNYIDAIVKLGKPGIVSDMKNHDIANYTHNLLFAASTAKPKKSSSKGLLSTITEEKEDPEHDEETGNDDEDNNEHDDEEEEEDDDDDEEDDDDDDNDIKEGEENGSNVSYSINDDLTMETRVTRVFLDVTQDKQSHFCLIGHELELIQAVYAMPTIFAKEYSTGQELPPEAVLLYSKEDETLAERVWTNVLVSDTQVDFTVKLGNSCIMALLNMTEQLSLPEHMKGEIRHQSDQKTQRVGLTLYVKSLISGQVVDIAQHDISLPSTSYNFYEYFANKTSAKEIARASFQKALLMKQAALRYAKKIGIPLPMLQQLIKGETITYEMAFGLGGEPNDDANTTDTNDSSLSQGNKASKKATGLAKEPSKRIAANDTPGDHDGSLAINDNEDESDSDRDHDENGSSDSSSDDSSDSSDDDDEEEEEDETDDDGFEDAAEEKIVATKVKVEKVVKGVTTSSSTTTTEGDPSISKEEFNASMQYINELLSVSNDMCSLLDKGSHLIDLPALLLAWLRISKEEDDNVVKGRLREMMRTIIMSFFRLGQFSHNASSPNSGKEYRLDDTQLPAELMEPLCALLPDANAVELPEETRWDGFEPNYFSLIEKNGRELFRDCLKVFSFTELMNKAGDDVTTLLDPTSLGQTHFLDNSENASELFHIFFDGDFPFHSRRTVERLWNKFVSVPHSLLYTTTKALLFPFTTKKKRKKLGRKARYIKRHGQYQSATISGFNMKLAVLHRILPKSSDLPSSMSDIEKNISNIFTEPKNVERIKAKLKNSQISHSKDIDTIAKNLETLEITSIKSAHAFESVCRWIYGVVSVRRPLFNLHLQYPVIGVYGAQGGGKSVLLRQLGFDSRAAFGKGNTKAFDAHTVGKTGVLMVDSYGFDEAVSSEEGSDEDVVDYTRTKKGFLSAFLSQVKYIIFTTSGTSQREYSKEEDQSLIQLRHVPCHVLNLITKFDGFLKKYPDDDDDGSALKQALKDAKTMIALRRKHNAEALPGKTVETRFYTSLYDTEDKHMKAMLQEAKKVLGDDFWTPFDLRKHMRSVLIKHCNVQALVATEAMGLNGIDGIDDFIDMPRLTLPIYNSQ